MKKIIENLRNKIKELAAQQTADKQDLRRKIRELAWKPGSDVTVAALRAERDENGYRRYGKKALKPYRRPETGSERCSLALSLGYGDWVIREHLLLYGMLRGRSYKEIEPKSRSLPSYWGLHNLLVEKFGTDPCPYTQADVRAWLEGKRTSLREVA